MHSHSLDAYPVEYENDAANAEPGPVCYSQAMQITVTIPDELAAQAKARGLALDSYLPEMLAKKLATESAIHPALEVESTGGSADDASARRNVAVEAMLGFAEKHDFTTGGQDLKSMVHEGHKY